MSMELMVLVNKHRFESPIQKLIFLQLADNADKSGRCWPSYQYVADTSGCGKSTVRKHLKILEKKGYLSIQNRKGVNGNSSNFYIINKSILQSDPVAPDSTGVCHEVAQGVAPDSTPPVAPGSTGISNSFEPVNEPKESKPKKIDFSEIDPPKNLNIPAWQKWMSYKKEIKKPYKTDSGIKTAMNTLAELSNDQQMNCINSSIGNEYQGFFIDKFTGTNNANNTKETTFERNEREHKEYLRERERFMGGNESQVPEPLVGTQRLKLL